MGAQAEGGGAKGSRQDGQRMMSALMTKAEEGVEEEDEGAADMAARKGQMVGEYRW